MKKRIVALMMTLLLLCSAAFAFTMPCEGIANTKDVRVRAKASSSGKVTATLKKGTAVTVLDLVEYTNSSWYKVQLANGKTGYILSDYLSVPETDYIEAAQASEDAVTMKVKVNASCADYNSVGKNWTQYFELNGIQIENFNTEVIAAPEVPLSVYCRIREQDKKPDTSAETTTYTPTAEEIAKGFTITQTIRVSENSGKYAGNTAVWKVAFTFEPVK